MAGLLGTYLVSLDDKGRLRIPSALKDQLPPDVDGRFVLNRGMGKCISLVTLPEWEVQSARVRSLDKYVIQNQEFIRKFFALATKVTLDGADRMLLPKILADYAGITKEVVITAMDDVVEIWNKDAYYGLVESTPEDFAQLAQRVMSNQNPGEL